MSSIPGKIDNINTARLDIALGTGHMINFEQWVPSDHKCIINVGGFDDTKITSEADKDKLAYSTEEIKD